MNLIISYFSQTPIYAQIQSQMKELIMNGELHSGDQLPSIRLMAKDLKVSVITVKRAYDELEREGVIHTLPGRGCFVGDINIDMVKKANLEMLRGRLDDIAAFAKSCGISREEIIEIIKEIYSGGQKHE